VFSMANEKLSVSETLGVNTHISASNWLRWSTADHVEGYLLTAVMVVRHSRSRLKECDDDSRYLYRSYEPTLVEEVRLQASNWEELVLAYYNMQVGAGEAYADSEGNESLSPVLVYDLETREDITDELNQAARDIGTCYACQKETHVHNLEGSLRSYCQECIKPLANKQSIRRNYEYNQWGIEPYQGVAVVFAEAV
jgi:hypothetical protein